MPKSRRRKAKTVASASRPPREALASLAEQAIRDQRQAFRDKFGRDPGPGDPLIFDPDEDKPTAMSALRMQADVLDAMRKAGTPPEIVYAFKKTGMLLTSESNASRKDRREWRRAIEEYHAIMEAEESVDRPNPSEWTTELPEMRASPFDKDDFALIKQILAAIAPISDRTPIKVITREPISPRSSWLLHAVRHSIAPARWGTTRARAPRCTISLSSSSSCERENFTPRDEHSRREAQRWPAPFAHTEQVVLRRAKEIYAEGRA